MATGAIVKTEKRVVNVRFSYKQRVFVEHFIVLDLDDKFDVVMGMPWLARHDPVIDWKKGTLVRFGRDSGTESDGPVTAAHAPAAGLHDEAPCDQAGLDIARPQTGAKTKRERFEEQGWDSLKSSPYYELLREYKDVLPEEIPAELPQDKGIQHEIDLVPGTKYCVTRQWPLPREQVKAIDDFFESRRKAGQVRESKSPHSAPTFCVKKPQGGWRIVHAYNKLNDATVPAQTPIPRKDVIIDSMAGSTVYSALDLRDGFYQILMRESDIPLTAVSTPSGMLWEWLVMPQGLKNAPATFNRCVTHLLRSVRDFAPSYFDGVFIHSRDVDGKTDEEMHRVHLRKLLELMRKHKLYANLKKCIFGASEIPVLGCLVGKNGVRPDPEKVRVINEWPTPSSVKELRQFLGLATYLCKYMGDYAGKIRPLSQLLKKEAV
ncbi:reverse transcriptase [Phytophthora cinnamomi]|uniref:reverse transcriptase n=1 Tax=Phytophthora cinnamomi TaxID=4785 RepID=UPI003559C112|nr:reverse transcriptase [Phytophthora cinnamomi]